VIAELTDAEIADLIGHEPPSVKNDGGEKSFLEGGTGTTASVTLEVDENAPELTPEEEADEFVSMAAQLGLSQEQARTIADKKLQEYRDGLSGRKSD